MRKYKFARFVAWTLIVCSLLFAIISVVAAIPSLGTLGGMLLTAGAVRGFALGLVASLVGFAFLALFDVAEAYVHKAQ